MHPGRARGRGRDRYRVLQRGRQSRGQQLASVCPGHRRPRSDQHPDRDGGCLSGEPGTSRPRRPGEVDGPCRTRPAAARHSGDRRGRAGHTGVGRRGTHRDPGRAHTSRRARDARSERPPRPGAPGVLPRRPRCPGRPSRARDAWGRRLRADPRRLCIGARQAGPTDPPARRVRCSSSAAGRAERPSARRSPGCGLRTCPS